MASQGVLRVSRSASHGVLRVGRSAAGAVLSGWPTFPNEAFVGALAPCGENLLKVQNVALL